MNVFSRGSFTFTTLFFLVTPFKHRFIHFSSDVSHSVRRTGVHFLMGGILRRRPQTNPKDYDSLSERSRLQFQQLRKGEF
jgi:hypothetical protein